MKSKKLKKGVDLTGQRFSRLVVLRKSGGTPSGQVWEVQCDCGQIRHVRTGKLTSGNHRSCGCLNKEQRERHQIDCVVYVEDDKRKCSKCKESLPVSLFPKSSKTKSGFMSHCRPCHAKYDRASKFGVTWEDSLVLLSAQGGKCPGCEVPLSLNTNLSKSTGKSANLDHCHATGEVRGFLCGNCNRAIGLVFDKPQVLSNLAKYLLKTHNKDQRPPMKLQDIVNQAHETAKKKGWWDAGIERSTDMTHMLMISEISEALEDYRAHKKLDEVWYEESGKPCGIASEAADLIIRIADWAGHKGLKFEDLPALGAPYPPPVPRKLTGEAWASYPDPTDFGKTFMVACARICTVTYTEMSSRSLRYAYWRICSDLVRYFDDNGYDLRVMIREKMDFNKTRPIRHGNKKV